MQYFTANTADSVGCDVFDIFIIVSITYVIYTEIFFSIGFKSTFKSFCDYAAEADLLMV